MMIWRSSLELPAVHTPPRALAAHLTAWMQLPDRGAAMTGQRGVRKPLQHSWPQQATSQGGYLTMRRTDRSLQSFTITGQSSPAPLTRR